MNLEKFNRILRQVLLLPILAVLLAALALAWQIHSASSTVASIQRADTHLAAAITVEKLVSDQESGLRGYETTSDPRFLQPYREAEAPLRQALEDLSTEVASDDQQRVQILRSTYAAWQQGFAVPVINAIQAGGNTDDVQLNLTGKLLMDQVRQQLNAISLSAEAVRARRIALWRSQLRGMLVALIALALVLGTLIGLFTRSRLRTVSVAYQRSLDATRRRADDIFRSEQQLRTTLASIGDGVITCDTTGLVQTINQAAREITGWTQSEAHLKPLDDIFHIVSEGTRAPLESPIARVASHNRAIGLAAHTILIRRDRTEVSIEHSTAPIRDQTGEMVGIVIAFRDVTTARRTQAALIANEKLAVAGRLAATIAHEIHNPLDSVSNLLYLMKTGSEPEETARFLDMAQQELDRVTQISRAMLSLYRESRAPVQVELRSMLEGLLLLMERRFQELGVTLTTRLPEPLSVEGFPAELRQVFTNLITNAAEAAGPAGQVTLTLEPRPASLTPEGHPLEAGATILVQDSGPGIPPEVQSHLFQPFFTTKGEQGTGLGLWVSRGIIQKHGGSILLTSTTDPATHGTTITVFLAAKPHMHLNT